MRRWEGGRERGGREGIDGWRERDRREAGGREEGRVGGRKGERERLKVNGSVDYITVSNNLHMYVHL